MDPESKKLLEDTFELAQENNKMLRKVRSVQKWASFWQGLKILIILGIAFGSFYYLEPYLNKVVNLYNSVVGAEQKLNSSNKSVANILKQLAN